MKHPIGQTLNGAAIYVDLIHSPAATSISQQPYLLSLLKEMAAQVKIGGPRPTIVQDMGRAIGNSPIVQTSSKDTIVYACRMHATVYSRFIKTSKPTSTQHLSATLKRDTDGNYELLDTWLGKSYPPLPGSTDETSESKTFWMEHAYILNGDSIQVRTLTKECPY